MSVSIIGTGSYAPPYILDNTSLSKMVDTSDEWIIERTGIKNRHIAKDETTEDMAYKSALKCLDNTGIRASDLDMIIVASVTSDTRVPSTAYSVAGRLGIGDIICMDVNSACSGYMYAISTAKALIKDMKKRYALVIGAERLTKYVNWQDRSTCILFGDGAGCLILENDEYEKEDVDSICLGNTENNCHINSPAEESILNKDKIKYRYEILDSILGGKPDIKKYLTMDFHENLTDSSEPYISMNGRQVYKFATDVGPKVIDKLVKDNGINIEDVYTFVSHQANMRIIQCLAEKSGIDISRWYTNIEEYGNTSSASVAIALDEVAVSIENHNEDDIDGKYILSTAFGGGLSFGGILMKIRKNN